MQLLGSNNLSLELKKKLIKGCIWSVAVCGFEIWTVGKNEETTHTHTHTHTHTPHTHTHAHTHTHHTQFIQQCFPNIKQL
jgi:hypothetical protein